jgi:hypothetical protein
MEPNEPAGRHVVERTGREPGRAESVAVGLVVVGLCSSSCFVAAWWAAAFLHLRGLAALSERGVAVSALAGLAVGLALGALNVRCLTRRFYAARTAVVVGVYLFWTAVMTALFMGLPVGMVGLGILVGAYAGRRQALAGSSPGAARASLARTSLLVACVTAAVSLAMGALAVADRTTLGAALGLVGLESLVRTTAGRVTVVVVAVPLLFVTQYWLTLASARWAARVGADLAE